MTVSFEYECPRCTETVIVKMPAAATADIVCPHCGEIIDPKHEWRGADTVEKEGVMAQMTEDAYVAATNITKIRAARALLIDCLAMEDSPIRDLLQKVRTMMATLELEAADDITIR